MVRKHYYNFRYLTNMLKIKSSGKDRAQYFILCFHYIGLRFGLFRNDPSHFAVQWKQKCCWIDPARFLFPFGVIQKDDKDCLLRHTY